MGDSLTHLQSLDSVKELFERAFESLKEGGKLVLSWRDLTGPLEGLERFIPVRSDGTRIFICFIEQGNEETVKVHHLLYSKAEGGSWAFSKSWYPKLKLSSETVAKLVEEAGLKVTQVEQGRLVVLVVEKRA
jgi:hypothetical protein